MNTVQQSNKKVFSLTWTERRETNVFGSSKASERKLLSLKERSHESNNKVGYFFSAAEDVREEKYTFLSDEYEHRSIFALINSHQGLFLSRSLFALAGFSLHQFNLKLQTNPTATFAGFVSRCSQAKITPCWQNSIFRCQRNGQISFSCTEIYL